MSEQSTSPQAFSIPEWTLGWRMQRALAHAEISVQQMADELGMARSSLSRWLNDHGTPPRAAFVKMWALRTGVPYEWLVTGETPQEGPRDPSGLANSQSGWTSSLDDATVIDLFPISRPVTRVA